MHAVTCTLQNLINQAVPDTVLLTMLTGLTKSKDKEYMVFKTISMFWTAVHFFFTCHAWLELWTVNSYSSLQRNKKLLRVSGKFELSRVRVG